MGKTLILYYSLEGSTRRVAEHFSKELNLPCEEIKPVKKIKTTGFLKYYQGGKQAMLGMKPQVQPLEMNLEEYDTILLGSPVWAGRFAPVIKTLLEKGYLKNKKIAFFYCSGGGPRKVEDKIRSSVRLHNSLISSNGIIMTGNDTKSQLRDALNWARKVM